jgi:hypothetical protein
LSIFCTEFDVLITFGCCLVDGASWLNECAGFPTLSELLFGVSAALNCYYRLLSRLSSYGVELTDNYFFLSRYKFKNSISFLSRLLR